MLPGGSVAFPGGESMVEIGTGLAILLIRMLLTRPPPMR